MSKTRKSTKLIFSLRVSEDECSVQDVVYTCRGPEPFITLKHIQAALYFIRFEMVQFFQCEWWWRGAKRTCPVSKF